MACQREGVQAVLHYLDDYLVVVAGGPEQCGRELQKLRAVFDILHVPIAMEKLEGPARVITFWGIVRQ